MLTPRGRSNARGRYQLELEGFKADVARRRRARVAQDEGH